MSRREPSWRRYLTFWRPAVDRDVDAEIRFHLDERVADLMARGRTETQAQAEAEEEFGDRATYRNRLREIDHRMQARLNRAEWLDAFRTDVLLTLRGMRRAPALSAMVIVTLALGIGANGAIFSMVDRVYLRPPPGVAAPQQLRRFYGDYKTRGPMSGFMRAYFSYPEYADMRDAVGSSHEMAAFGTNTLQMGTDDNSPKAQVTDVVGDYFRILGVRPWRGRFFAPDELPVTTPNLVVVVSHRFWERQLRADTSIVGKEIQLGRRKFTVIGIAPSGFDGTDLGGVDVWRPANANSTGTGTPWYTSRNTARFQVLARLDGALSDVVLTQTANNGLHRATEERLAMNTTINLGPIIAARGPTEGSKESAIALRLGGVTLIVLLIAIANVTNLLLTRAIQRRREIAVRVALGVSRARLAAQLVTESAVLAIVAGVVALIIATWGAVAIRTLLLPDIQWPDSPLDPRLAGFTFLIALLAGGVAGVLPFARMGRLDLADAMRGGARDGGAARSKTRAILIIAQAALSVVLLSGAALFLRSLQAVNRLDLGYDVSGVITAQLASGARVIPYDERAAALGVIRDRVEKLPGVRAAALANLGPMQGLSAERLFFPGYDSVPSLASGPPTFTAVSPGFFKAAGISIRAGRAFTDADRDGAPRGMIVTETMARFIWHKPNPIGECVHIETATAPCTSVIGVVEDVRRDRVIEEPMLLYYLPIAQAPEYARPGGTLVIGADPASVPRVRGELRALMLQALPGSRPDIQTMADYIAPQYRPWRIGASLFTVFGVLALLVAAIGVYSAIAYAVTQRSHELGVRMALGAQRAAIGRMVVGSGVRLVGIGVVIGVITALALSRLIESLLYGTSARDPVVLAEVASMLLLVAVLAAAFPAWRATRLDPVRALRAE